MAVALSDKTVLERHDRQRSPIATHDDLTRGMAIVDDRGYTQRTQSTRVVTEANREHFLTLLKGALA